MAGPLRIVFAGTPDFALPVFDALTDWCDGERAELVGAFTQPDRRAGRGRRLRESPVKVRAVERAVPVFQPRTFKDEAAQRALRELEPDLMIVVAYGLLLPQRVLDTPRHGCVNVHASLLPRWRGAAPIQRALLAGDRETGASIMQMDAGLDTGPVWAVERCAIARDETGASLHDKLAVLGAELLMMTLPKIIGGTVAPVAQPQSGATYANKVDKREAQIDWRLGAEEIERAVRAFDPWPVAETRLDGTQLRIWSARAVGEEAGAAPGTVVSVEPDVEVATGAGRLRLVTVQRAGGRKVSADAFVNAHPMLGAVLGDTA